MQGTQRVPCLCHSAFYRRSYTIETSQATAALVHDSGLGPSCLAGPTSTSSREKTIPTLQLLSLLPPPAALQPEMRSMRTTSRSWRQQRPVKAAAEVACDDHDCDPRTNTQQVNTCLHTVHQSRNVPVRTKLKNKKLWNG